MSKNGSDGIFRDTGQLIDGQLGNHKHGTVGKGLFKAPQKFSAKKLIEGLIIQIEKNLEQAQCAPSGGKLGTSAENWRETSPTQEHDKRRPERDLEHRLVSAGRNDRDWSWWNQMPIASGLVGHRADRTRAIDLVCRQRADPGHYRLIELKLDRRAGAPLAALMEILRYGLVYFSLRKKRKRERPEGILLNAPIFEANQIELCVLAPRDYYDSYRLAWLEKSLTSALNEIVEDQLDGNLTMNLSSYWPTRLTRSSGLVLSDPDLLKSYLTDWTKAFPS